MNSDSNFRMCQKTLAIFIASHVLLQHGYISGQKLMEYQRITEV